MVAFLPRYARVWSRFVKRAGGVRQADDVQQGLQSRLQVDGRRKIAASVDLYPGRLRPTDEQLLSPLEVETLCLELPDALGSVDGGQARFRHRLDEARAYLRSEK